MLENLLCVIYAEPPKVFEDVQLRSISPMNAPLGTMLLGTGGMFTSIYWVWSPPLQRKAPQNCA